MLNSSVVKLMRNKIARLEQLEDDDGSFVLGWAGANLCVKFLNKDYCRMPGAGCNIVAVDEATVWSAEEVQRAGVLRWNVAAEVNHEHMGKAQLLLRQAIVDKTIADLKAAIEVLEGKSGSN